MLGVKLVLISIFDSRMANNTIFRRVVQKKTLQVHIHFYHLSVSKAIEVKVQIVCNRFVDYLRGDIYLRTIEIH